MRPVHVRVERLVLEGFSPAEQGAVAEAIRGALASRVRGGVPLGGALTEPAPGGSPLRTRIDAGVVPAEPGAIGRAVAGAVSGQAPPPGRPGSGRR